MTPDDSREVSNNPTTDDGTPPEVPAVPTPQYSPGVGFTPDLNLRVSGGVLTLVTVEEEGKQLAILERVVRVHDDADGQVSDASKIEVIAKPLGGGVQVEDPSQFAAKTGEFNWHREADRESQDLRICISADNWPLVRGALTEEFSGRNHTGMVERESDRELAEEIGDAIGEDEKSFSARFGGALNASYSGVVFQDPEAGAVAAASDGAELTARVFVIYDVTTDDEALKAELLAAADKTNSELADTAAAGQKKKGKTFRQVTALTAIPVDELMSVLNSANPITKIPLDRTETDQSCVLADNTYSLSPVYQEERPTMQ